MKLRGLGSEADKSVRAAKSPSYSLTSIPPGTLFWPPLSVLIGYRRGTMLQESILTASQSFGLSREGCGYELLSIAAQSTLKTSELDVNTMIFAIGDKHDPTLGLPFGANGYVTNPDGAPGAAYEVFEPASQSVREGMFVVGWARNASEGLVGIARHDGEVGATNVLQYLERVQKGPSASVKEIARFIERRDIQVVPKADLVWLSVAEEREARLRGVLSYKFSDDRAMLSAIEEEKSNSAELEVLVVK